jgi:hypothetical protein
MIIVVLFPGIPGAADIAPLTEIPGDAIALYNKLIEKVQPNDRQFINHEAFKLRMGSIDEHTVSNNLNAHFSTEGIVNINVTEATFLALVLATRDMEQDIKNMMEEVKTLTSAKQKLQDIAQRVNQDAIRNASKKDSDVCAPPECGGYQASIMEIVPVLKRVRNRKPLVFPEPANIGQLRKLAEDLKDNLDGMNEMSEMTSMRLQMTMDRHSKFISTLRELMKKISSTQETIRQKIK